MLPAHRFGRGVFFAAIVSASVLLATPEASAATLVSGPLAAPATWTTAGSPYVLQGNVSVSSALIIEPGTVVKLGAGNSLSVTATGSLTASGAVFTSRYDDAHGGNTDPEGDTQAPGVLQNGWGAVSSSGTLSINESQFYYGGRANQAAVEVFGGSATLAGNRFQYANNGFLQQGGTASVRQSAFEDIEQFAVWQQSGHLTFGANTFSRIARESYLLSADTFVNEGGNQGERHINLQSLAITGETSLPADGLPYQLNTLRIEPAGTLTLGPGAIAKLFPTQVNLDNRGTFRAQGTAEAPVTLTSYHDDAVGGDSNQDGPSPVGPGAWGRLYNSGRMELTHASLRYGGSRGGDPGVIINQGDLAIERSRFADAATRFIAAQSGRVTIQRSEFRAAPEILVSSGAAEVTLRESDLLDTEGFRIWNAPAGMPVDARHNYWGRPEGPVINGDAQTEPAVTTNVLVEPFLTASALCRTDCFSNVLFLPGIMGSRLYETEEGNEDELWYADRDSRHERLAMKDDGTSVNDVYTKDDTQRGSEWDETGIVDDTRGFNLYESFLNDLRDWKTEGLFADYAFIPYDWRRSLEDVVMNGQVTDGKLRYSQENTDISRSYLYQQAKALQATSKSEKITLIGHSNGGLVIKAFIQKLKDANDPLYHQIDKVIFVGVPQTGTPDAVVSMLYGSKVGIAWFGVSAARTRDLVRLMPGMYNLLPSERLVAASDPLIEFSGNNIDPAWKDRYGNQINTHAELQEFLRGAEGRGRPAFADTSQPEVLHETRLSEAEAVHQALDTWTPAAETEVIQIAGWGMYTSAGLRVEDSKYCVFNESQIIDGRPVCTENRPSVTLRDKLSLDGDATVLTDSALGMPEGERVKKYWVDLARYNEAVNANIFTIRKHKNLLEVNTLRPLIKSLIARSETNWQFITTTMPPALEDIPYYVYEVHSPLHLTITDADGKVTGWDSATGTIVEAIKGAQYFEIGDIKTVLIPKDIQHTVKLEAYAQGSFTLDISELDGEEIVSETKFEAIPTLANSVVEVEPATLTTPASLAIDFDADGAVETTLSANPGETAEYQNPQATDTTPPEINVTFDQAARDVVWSAHDATDTAPVVTVDATRVKATDAAGNVTEIPFTKYREGNTRLRVQYEQVIYNGEVTTLDKTNLVYDWQLKKGQLTDLDTDLRIKDKSRLKMEYRKAKNETRIVEKDKEEKTKEVTTILGLVYLEVSTKEKHIIWEF